MEKGLQNREAQFEGVHLGKKRLPAPTCPVG